MTSGIGTGALRYQALSVMVARRALLDPADVQVGVIEVDLIPAQVDQLADPEAEATRIMVASRWPQRLALAAFISLVTSRSVRCSRVR